MKAKQFELTAAAAVLTAFATCAEDLCLTQDTTVDVPSGVVEYDALTGGEFKLTKTGSGTLKFKAIANSDATVCLIGGRLLVEGAETAPQVLSSALLYLDTSAGLSFLKKPNGEAPTADYAGSISTWSDVNGGRISAYQSGVRVPFLRPGSTTVSGYPLIDFGSVRIYSSGTMVVPGKGYFMKTYVQGAAAKVSGVADLFLVASDTEDVKTTMSDYGVSGTESRATPFVGNGYSDSVSFLRGERTASGLNSAIARNGSDPQKRLSDGEILFDGVQVPYTTPYPDGLHLLEYRPTAAVEFSSLANERDNFTGGVRLGAVVAFAERLSDADRLTVRNYLLTRWVPAPLKRLELNKGTVLEFSRAAGLHVKELSYAGTATLSGGALTCDNDLSQSGMIETTSGGWTYAVGASGNLPRCAAQSASVTLNAGWITKEPVEISATPFLHVDASVAGTLTTSALNGTNFVSTWRDADGGSVKAEPYGSYNKPFLRAGFLAGKSVVDFGTYSVYDDIGRKFATAGGWGGLLKWSETCSNVREVISVSSDTEDLVENWVNITNTPGTMGQRNRAAPFVGSTSLAHFLRGNRNGSGTDSAPILLGTAAAYATTQLTVDGVQMAAGDAYPSGFHVLDLRSGKDALSGNAFGTDRCYCGGGTRIAEFYVFGTELGAEDRRALVNRMGMKWLGAESEETVPYSRLSVGEDASYVAVESKIAVAQEFNLSGKMTVNTLDISGQASIAPAAALTGALKLEDGATLVLDLDTVAEGEPVLAVDKLTLPGGKVTIAMNTKKRSGRSGTEVPLVTADAVSGSAEFLVGGDLSGKQIKFVWKGNTLYACFERAGLMLISR